MKQKQADEGSLNDVTETKLHIAHSLVGLKKYTSAKKLLDDQLNTVRKGFDGNPDETQEQLRQQAADMYALRADVLNSMHKTELANADRKNSAQMAESSKATARKRSVIVESIIDAKRLPPHSTVDDVIVNNGRMVINGHCAESGRFEISIGAPRDLIPDYLTPFKKEGQQTMSVGGLELPFVWGTVPFGGGTAKYFVGQGLAKHSKKSVTISVESHSKQNFAEIKKLLAAIKPIK